MKKIILILLLLMCSFLYGITGKVTSVYDGDTITVTTSKGERVKVRFYGIDSPEVKPSQPYGLEARNYLNSMIYNKEVEIDVKEKDRYGRTVGEVFYKGKNVNLDLVSNGYAWYYETYARGRNDLREAQTFAKTNKKGLWQEKNPVAPWEFRRNN